MKKIQLFGGLILALLLMIIVGAYLARTMFPMQEEHEIHGDVHIAKKEIPAEKPPEPKNPQVKKAMEIMKGQELSGMKSNALLEALVSDIMVDELAGRYNPSNIFPDADSIEPTENIDVAIKVFPAENGGETVEVIDKTAPNLRFCYMVSNGENGEIDVTAVYVNGYEFVHQGESAKPLLPMENVTDPYHGMEEKLEVEHSLPQEMFFGSAYHRKG